MYGLLLEKACTADKPSDVFRKLLISFEQVSFIGLDKSGYRVNSFLISPRKHMLWVLIRSAYVFVEI